MDYYKDLTYYSHFHYEKAKNIGFGRQSAAREGRVSELFLKKAAEYLKHPVNTVRGGSRVNVDIDGQSYTLGFSEIRVLDGKGNVYAAPDSILAAVADGSYVPPLEFEEAVLYGVSPDSEEYRKYIERYKPDCCWGASNEYVKDVVMLLALISGGDWAELEKTLDSRKDLMNIVCGGGSLLNEAIARGQEEIALQLIKKGIDLEMFEGAEMLTAVDKGMISVVRLLNESSAPVKKDKPRTNPLFLAIARKQNEIAQYLFANRKDMIAVYTTEYVRNCNILQWAKRYSNDEMISFMSGN